jgi:hypothetical protein
MTPNIARALARGALAGALLLPALAPAAPLEPGSPAPQIALADQHDRPVSVGPATAWLIFAPDMPASNLANQVLQAQQPGVLERLKAVYLADISAMPSMVTTMFALPKMRERHFAIGLARDASQVADLPRRAGEVTVLVLRDGRVGQVIYAGDEAALRRMLGLETR